MKTIDHLQEPVEPGPPRRPTRRWVIGIFVVALVAVMALVAVVVAVDPGDDEGDAPTPTTTPTTSAPSTSAPVVDRSTAIWPFPGSAVRPADPVEAAREFAVTYLGFSSPLVGDFQQGDSRSAEVEVRPRANGPVTTIMVRQLGNETSWSVLGAATASIEVTSPRAGDEIASPVHVTGRAVAFEGNVQVEVRQDGDAGAIGEGFVTGGGDIMRGFEGSIPFETPGEPFGALVFFTESAENGEVWEAAALRVRLASTDSDAATCGGYRAPRFLGSSEQMDVKAYFNCDAGGDAVAPFPVYRLVPRSSGVLRASLEAMLEGPNAAERTAGLGSWFSSATDGMLRSVNIREGHAIVDLDDLRPVIPNASSSAGSALLLSQLDATVFQFRSVDSVEYRIEGSCEAFNEWLQFGGCEPRTREISTD